MELGAKVRMELGCENSIVLGLDDGMDMESEEGMELGCETQKTKQSIMILILFDHKNELRFLQYY
eukprot:6348916-Ditylum_brightwellii.AAC.1